MPVGPFSILMLFLMETVQGDLISLAKQGAFDVIAHGCNCFCTMGAGIALGIKREFPAAYEADLATTKGAREKLGTCSVARVRIAGDRELTIVNAYTQFHWSQGPKPLADYDAIRACMGFIQREHAGRRIGLPKIGAGLAGGDWTRIAAIIESELAGEEVTIVEFAPQR
jgi:O-acetyl-ADP-ribose deacetylase (regulator of RNase III)